MALSIPQDGEFDEAGFLAKDDLTKLYDALIKEHAPQLGFLKRFDIAVLWKRKGGMTGGRERLGNAQRPGGLLKHFSSAVFVVWLAADHIRQKEFSDEQIAAALFHQLCKLDSTGEEDKPTLQGPDIVAFRQEIEHYGPWNPDLTQAAATFQQLKLPAD